MGRVPCFPRCPRNSHTIWHLAIWQGFDPMLLGWAASSGVVQETGIASWRRELPPLTARHVVLREPTSDDIGALVDLLSVEDASRFGLEAAVDDICIQLFVERAARDREAG